MSQLGPVARDRDLLGEIERSVCPTPALWWLGHSSFVLKYKNAILYLDPYLSPATPERPRLIEPPVQAADVRHAGLILCTHAHPGHLDPDSAPAMLSSSPRAKLVVPKAVAAYAFSIGIPYHRMVTTDAGLRVEYMDDRIYAVPSAHNNLSWTPADGYPQLGYLVRFGDCTIYHAGDCVPYDGLADRLRPYNVTIALLPISGCPANFEIAEAAQLSEAIGARWLVPMHYNLWPSQAGKIDRFIEHMLGHRPAQRFKIFECGEKWVPPPE